MSNMLGSWRQLDSKDIPFKFLAFCDAYLDSAERLCKVLKRSTRKATYERGAVVLYLTFHSVELFFKACILHKRPDERFHHDIKHYEKRYRNIYPGKKYKIEIPFGTEYSGQEPPDIEQLVYVTPPQEQLHRYPVDKHGKKWNVIPAFEPTLFLIEIERLKKDICRVKAEIFNS
jgi:hypothetical protein